MKNIEKLYTDPSNPGSFSGIDGFLRANKNIKRSDLLNYLKNSETYTLHKPQLFPSKVASITSQLLTKLFKVF